MKLIFDIETNGLLREARKRFYDEDKGKWVEGIIPQLTTTWCIVAIDETTNNIYSGQIKLKKE